jgi:2-polyprenyl-3-methyl-5-hydroxy-6-metoxy-1,4-benzoquinol methylase
MMRVLRKGVNALIGALGYELRRRTAPAQSDAAAEGDLADMPYQENAEVGPVNIRFKRESVAERGPFEWPNIVALNRTVAGMLDGAKRIAELGGGTGCFAYEAATDPGVTVVCSELDAEASHWAMEHRARPNITYTAGPILAKDGPFDLVVAIEVIEHVADYRSFIETCIALAPRVLLTTPNKNRSPEKAVASPPAKLKHVREWTAGELYWVLRTFFRTVELWAMADQFTPGCQRISITDTLTPCIAVCTEPIC